MARMWWSWHRRPGTCVPEALARPSSGICGSPAAGSSYASSGPTSSPSATQGSWAATPAGNGMTGGRGGLEVPAFGCPASLLLSWTPGVLGHRLPSCLVLLIPQRPWGWAQEDRQGRGTGLGGSSRAGQVQGRVQRPWGLCLHWAGFGEPLACVCPFPEGLCCADTVASTPGLAGNGGQSLRRFQALSTLLTSTSRGLCGGAWVGLPEEGSGL